MANIHKAIVCLFTSLLILAFSCNTDKNRIKCKVEEMRSVPIDLCLDKLSCKLHQQKHSDYKYKMIVYVDSTECTPCELGHLRFYIPLIDEAKKNKTNVGFYFIIAPKVQDWFDLNTEIEETDIHGNIYIDSTYIFLNNNPTIPKEKKYHSFMLDRNNRIVFIGSPIDNERIKGIYKKSILK